ncbi:MAG: serine/threonine protein kinase [Labilithrix sp.]|nr:serine/threonine protein kinase [Labilithrix sp.]MCW5810567.1 serine/threonine protein kinase [Labilithrix sp.]
MTCLALVPDEMPKLGSYTLFEKIGRGGMAELFLARQETELGATRLVVVKVILPAFASDKRFAEMLIHEAKLAARLGHRHIAQVIDLGRADGRLFIAMEYVEGVDLTALLRHCSERGEGLPPEHAVGIACDVLAGLDYAHRRTTDAGVPLGIVHRDVSPSNVLVSFDGDVKLCDFGIAHANDLVAEDAADALKGKAGYMSPEHARGHVVDARSDVFAAGVVLWELLAGQRLYRPRGPIPLIEQARMAEIPPLPERGFPQHDLLSRIVSRALKVDRAERYSSAAIFQLELEEYLVRTGLLARRLHLGDWIAQTLGTQIVEQRRASERRLPPSTTPPALRSGVVKAGTSTARVSIPAAPKVPLELVLDEESSPFLPPADVAARR